MNNPNNPKARAMEYQASSLLKDYNAAKARADAARANERKQQQPFVDTLIQVKKAFDAGNIPAKVEMQPAWNSNQIKGQLQDKGFNVTVSTEGPRTYLNVS